MFLKLIEAPRGIGTLWVDGKLSGAVRYSLRVKQEMHDLPPSTQQEPMPGLLQVEGKLDRIEDQDFFNLNGKQVTLEIEDGRRVDLLLLSATGKVGGAGEWPAKL